MQTYVIAVNDKGKTRRFTQASWDGLGANKEGWRLQAEQPISNQTPKELLRRPGTGQTSKPSTKPADQKIENVVGKKPEQKISDVNSQPAASTDGKTGISDEQKTEFLNATEGINAGQIKEFFDNQKPPIAFDKKAKRPELVQQLGNHLGWDAKRFQEIFS